jgi:hypothetical protein
MSRDGQGVHVDRASSPAIDRWLSAIEGQTPPGASDGAIQCDQCNAPICSKERIPPFTAGVNPTC